MDCRDIFVWPDGSWRFREEYEDVTDRWLGNDFEILYVGTPEYYDYFDFGYEYDEGGPDEDYYPDSD